MGTTTTMAYQTGSGFEDRLTGLNLKGKYNYLESSYLTFGYEFRKHDMDRTAITYYGFNMGPIAQRHTMTTLLDMKKQSHSVYALDSHSFNDKFSISGGARYEYANYKGDRSYNSDWLLNMGTAFADRYYTNKLDNRHTNNFALEITPNFSYSDTGRVYVKYERGFISPTPAQFVNRRNDLPAGQNPYEINHLDSETFDTFEIGTRDFLWDFYEYNFTLFYTQTSDEITYFGDPHALDGGTGNINGFWRYLNIDETRRYGAELSLNQYFLDDTLILSQSFSYVDAKISKGINDGRLIPYVSKFKATAGLDYAWTPNFKTFIDLSYLSRAKDGGLPDATTGKMSGSKWTKEQFITDIGANYTYKNLSIFGGIKNLFDYKYYNYQGPIENAGVRTGTRVAPADGRSYYVELKYKF